MGESRSYVEEEVVLVREITIECRTSTKLWSFSYSGSDEDLWIDW